MAEIMSAEAVYNADWDSSERDAVVASHEALRALAEEQRERAAQWYTLSMEQEETYRTEVNRLDEALVARAFEVSHQAALIAVISPYVQHRPFCVKSGDRCTCGLITALTEVNKTLETIRAE
jgi:hypothetical protein